jgi:hypothetical protein
VPVFDGEFGVYYPVPPADAAHWLRDARRALDGYGIGWAVWSYDTVERFTLGRHVNRHARIVLSRQALRALGLGGG